MSQDLVYAISSCATSDANGVIVRLVECEPWDANDPLVKARPALFSSVPSRIRRTVPASLVVEKATKAPGEKRA